MRIVSPLIFLLILLPFVGIGQPRPPDPDIQPGGTEVQIARNPGTVIDGGGGQISELWINPNAARVQDDAYASLTTSTKNKTTNYLLAQSFGFNIPAGSSIVGIIVQVDRYATVSGGTVRDAQVRLIDATGEIGFHDESSLVPWSPIDLDNYQTYGGVTETWGLADWTSSKINNVNFGVAIMAETSNDNTTFNLFVDEIRVTVVYLTGGAARYAVASGLWSSTSSWSTIPGGPAGASTPAAANDVFIGGGHTITDDLLTIQCNSLTIGTTETIATGNLAFTGSSNNLGINQGGLVITSNGDVVGTFAPVVEASGDVTLNSVLTNRNFILRLTPNLGENIISGTGSVAHLVVEDFFVNTGNLTVTRSLLGDAFRLINGSNARLTYSGPDNNTATLLLDLTAPGNTVEFSQTLVDASDFDVHKLSVTYQNLIISGNAPKFYNGPITINEDLTITSSGILSNLQQTDLTLHGNWTNNNGIPGFVPGSCNNCWVIFAGGNAQTITNAAGEQFHRMEVTKVAGTTLTAINSVIINNQLLMTEGNFDIGGNSLNGTANTVFNGGELSIGTIGTTVPALTGSYTLSGGVFNFTGAGSQTIRSSASTPAIAAYLTVRFLGSGTKSLSGNIAVSTDLSIGGSATLDVTASNYAINLAGNWTNAATFLPQNGTVVLNGTAAQTIANLAGENFNNLTINNSFTPAVILADPVSVNGLVTFTNGHIIAADTSLLTLGTGATIASVSDASHVAGTVAKVMNTAAVFAFPIGSGITYMPASITPTSTTSTTFVARYFSLEQSVGTTEFGIDHVSAQDYWTIDRTTGTAEAAVTLVWKYASAADAEIDNLADLLVAQWDGSNWTSRGNAGTTGDFVAGSVTSNTVSSFTPHYFVIGSSTDNNPLSNRRFFAPLTGNWNDAGAWSYRLGGATTAPEPTSTKFVIIPAGNTATMLDSPGTQATKSMRSLTVLGTLALGDAVSQNVTVNVGDRGFTLGPDADITGTDNGDQIHIGGDINLNNTSSISHTLLETDFATEGNTVSGSGGNLPILNVNQDGQIFTGSTSFTALTVGSTATNNGTITVTGSFSGNGLTNAASGTFIWQGTSASGNGINATAPGNTIQLVNNTGSTIDIDQFVTAGTFGNLVLGGANNFIEGSDTNINGDLTILPGGLFVISSGNHALNVSGNWINDGTFNATSGTVGFTGTTAFSGASTNNFNHVLISGTATAPSMFNVRGNFTNNGSFITGTGTVVFNGTTAQSISGTVVTPFNNISVTNPSAVVQVQSDQYMTGMLSLSASAVFDADGSADNKIFTLLSSADKPTIDASIAELPLGASVSGQVTVQRYMAVEGNNNSRIYRYISSPVQNAPVSQIQPFIPVTGTFAGSSSCTDCTTNPSMFLYDETVITDIDGSGANNFNDGNIAFPAVTNSETFSPGRGYLIFVRGNVEPILGFDSVVWSLRGPINSGNVALPVTFTSTGIMANDGWNLVGNPYPSTIDWDATGWTRSNLDNTTYMLDNGLASPVYATHVAGGASTNGGSRYIATGQAFFVKSNGGTPILQAAESVKAAGTQTTYIRTNAIENLMRVTLRQGTKTDETVIQFKSGATSDFDLSSDAHKLDNPEPMYNLATLTSELRYAINALPTPTSGTEVPLDLTSVTPGNYSLEFTEFESFADHAMSITLRDDFLGTTTDIRKNPNYAFSVTADSRSFGSTRFTIVFGVSTITGLEPMDGQHIAVYPVPAKNIVSIEVRSDEEVSATIVSLTGASLLEQKLPGGHVKRGSFNLEELSDGLYILMIQDGSRQFVHRLLKKE